MVGATPQQQQQQQASTTPPTAEEEALKRNTDCVYFLTSPLACKKGAECEYRHSEYARVNPRDCYFWLNGNCMNPKCGFRHPPLDGLFAETEASAGSFLPPPRIAVTPAFYAPQIPGKPAVQCHFFQKGACGKGDRCGFLHGPNPTSSKSSQMIVSSPSTELPPPTKPHTSHQKFTQEVKIQQATFAKAVEAPVETKPAPKPEIGSRRNGIERNLPPSKKLHDEVPRYKATNIQPVVNGNPSRFNRMHQSQVPDDHGSLNGKDADEFLRESSPGFDVLVDDELRNSDFYHGEDQYGRTRGQEGRNSNPVNEYDIGQSVDYSSVGDMDRETYRDLRGYDNYEHIQGQYGWEQHRSSSERMLLGQAQLESRAYSKVDSPEPSDDIDLRYRLSKHRRGNGLRSVVSHDFAPDKNVEERVYQGSSARESSIGGRLRGRIKLPRRSPSGSDLRVEREVDKVRSRGRLSPGRSQVPSHQGRLRDRIKGRVEGDYDSEGRNPRGARMRREMMDDRSTNFAGPKRLAELKSTVSSEGRMQESPRKRKQLEDYQPSEGDLSFEGPMPLSEILKRKRVSEAGASGNGSSSSNRHDNNQSEIKEKLVGSSNNTTVGEPQTGLSSVKKVVKDEEESKSTTVENEVAPGQDSSVPNNEGEPETESGMIVDDDGMEEHEYEGDDQREVEYEYEQVDEGEYYEGENVEAEEEDVDDDDFAKKIGVTFS
ncbi:zinc finger CCCH domain-containing protein 17 [Euphorbia lathyris]|uniref:zinc finger CCCH domain-containing protein 17 n=1 Tax=Euphorbia lathyris TaxID=212925 RepID=UPI003313F5BA